MTFIDKKKHDFFLPKKHDFFSDKSKFLKQNFRINFDFTFFDYYLDHLLGLYVVMTCNLRFAIRC